MKQRFSSLDVRVIAKELSESLTNLRVSNIYDLSSRIFLLKFARPGKREQLLIDSGFRCHLTSFSRTAASTPSAFVSRLRKYLKSRRVTGVHQIGTDRVIEIIFSDGQYRLFLEFFAAGNIILTDADLTVLTLLRLVNEGDEDVDVKLGGKYILTAKQNYNGIPSLSQERIEQSLQAAVQRTKVAQEIGGKKAKRAKGSDDLIKALNAGFPEFPPHLLEHAFVQAGLDVHLKVESVINNEISRENVIDMLKIAQDVLQSLDGGSRNGYIIAKEKPANADTQVSDSGTAVLARETLLYDDFHPFRPAQFSGRKGIQILELEGFNRTVDEFYSSLESQKLESRLTEREEAAKKKLDTAKSEHEKRLGALQQVQEMHIRKAQAIEANTHRVEEACSAVNGLIGQGMDWMDIGKLIENEQGRGNAVAEMIKLPLKLYENTVTLLLDEPGLGDESESDEEDRTDDEADSDDGNKTTNTTDKRLAIDIDLALSPWANARQYYNQKKSAAVKEQKTIQAATKALKSTEKKIEADLKKGLKQEKAALRPARKQFWFEKFLYFISSDGYLVIGGKDAQQNELLYARYLKKGDIYVHADLHGASSVVVKNNPQTPDAPVPPSTLSQAGTLSVCTSSAWDSKAVMAAWWVNADQVSKTAQTGEYLNTGGFMIRGKKNFLPPAQLLLGFGVYWLISEDSRVNHSKHRIFRTESMLDGEAEALAADAQGFSMEEDEQAVEHDEQDDDSKEAIQPQLADTADDTPGEESPDEEPQAGHTVDDRSLIESDGDEARDNPLQNSNNRVPVAKYEDETDNQPAEIVSEATTESSDDEDEDEPENTQPTGTLTSSKQASTQAKSTKQPQMVRGKRSKQKKAAKKYADQDEEDRELAMKLLGSAQGQQRKQAADEEKAARLAKIEADKARRKAQHIKKAEQERLRQDRMTRNGDTEGHQEESADVEQLEIERKEHANIDLLVPVPEPGDELLAAVPVVAPWGALGRCKYKVKLQPGNVKKGKAIKEIIAVWTSLANRGPKVFDESNKDKEKVWAREIELLKQWRFEEVVGFLPVKGVRIVQGGGLAGSSSSAAGSGKGKGGVASKGGRGGKKGR